MADFAKLTHVASEVEGNMLVGRLKDAGLQAFVQPSVSPVQGKLYTGELGMAASGADVCVAAERLEEAKGLLNQWNAIQPDEAELAAESEETGEIPPEYVTLLRKNGMTEQEIAVYERKYRELIAQYGEKYWSYDCGATYKGYLKFYIDKIRKRGAAPVLLTPPPRGVFKNGKIVAVAGQHGGEDAFGAFPYVRAIRQLGRQENVIVLDLFQRSLELLERLGETTAKSLQSIKDKEGVTIGEARYGRPEKWVEDYDIYWEKGDFTVDKTHQNRLGSYLYAAIIADCISEQISNLTHWQLPCASKSMRCPARIRTFIPVMEAAVHHIGIKIV